MDKKIIDELTVFLEDKTDDEYEIFNKFATEYNYCFTFEESLYLIDVIKRLKHIDKRILLQTIKIIKDGK